MSDVNKISTNIDDYTYAELLLLLDLNDTEALNIDSIVDATEPFIQKYRRSNRPQLVTFFEGIREKLVLYADKVAQGEDEDVGPQDEQTQQWVKDAGGLPQDDKNQRDKNTDRFQKVDVYGNSYVPMEREKLGINNNYNVDVAQDGKLNPTLTNTTNRMVVIDSFYRQDSAGGNISTDFTLDLSDRLTKVLNMRVWSIQIPLTYYNVDDVYGNTCFWITNGSQDIPISIAPGSYTPESLVLAIDATFINNGFDFSTPPASGFPISYNANTFKIKLDLYGGTYTPPVGTPYTPFVINANTTITFFNANKRLICKETCIPQALHVNETLGYIMGFQSRTGYYQVDLSGNIAEGIVDLFGPRYFILVVDDFTQNHLNNGMVTITEPSKIVKLPSYYTTDHPYVCVDGSNNAVTPELIQSSPRTLTQNQLYTINEILKNNTNNFDSRAKAPTTTNVLGILPIKPTSTGSMYVDFSGPIQENQRTYFGPVDIERLRVRLLDDKGNTLNLNGANWSFTLLCELLYQY